MDERTLYPLQFHPVFKDYIWGGRNLARLGRKLPEGIVAESWEIAAHPNGDSLVTNGIHQGKSLSQLTKELGEHLVGSYGRWALRRGKFPLLIKLIDANQALSVQVHPQDAYALQHEGNELGKTEMWVVLAAVEGARLILGVRQGCTREVLQQAILAGDVSHCLHSVPVQQGDHICVPAGTLHAIMEGLIIAEIQQNSDTTYRVFDWNRLGADGKPRPLHIEKALDVTDYAHPEPQIKPPVLLKDEDGIKTYGLCANEYFITERVAMSPDKLFTGTCDGRTLEVWVLLEGSAHLNGQEMKVLDFLLLPAAMGRFTIGTHNGAVLLRSRLPEPFHPASNCCA